MNITEESASGRPTALRVLSIGVVCALFGCGGVQPPADCDAVPIGVHLVASPQLNPSATGESLPTQVALLQLASAEAARLVSFGDFWESEPAGEAVEGVLAREDLTLFPGKHERRWLERHPDVQWLLAAALVREPDGNAWRELAVLPKGDGVCGTRVEDSKRALTFALHGYAFRSPSWRRGATGRAEVGTGRAEFGGVQ